jgi:hypothetical protein
LDFFFDMVTSGKSFFAPVSGVLRGQTTDGHCWQAISGKWPVLENPPGGVPPCYRRDLSKPWAEAGNKELNPHIFREDLQSPANHKENPCLSHNICFRIRKLSGRPCLFIENIFAFSEPSRPALVTSLCSSH